jgi:hypothetical protein
MRNCTVLVIQSVTVIIISDNTVRDKRATQHRDTVWGEKDTYEQAQCFKRIGLFLPDVRLTEEQPPVVL